MALSYSSQMNIFLPLPLCGDVNSWADEGWQNDVEQVLADYFCQCCHIYGGIVSVMFSICIAAATSANSPSTPFIIYTL